MGRVSFAFALLEVGTQCKLVFLGTPSLKTKIQKVSDTQFWHPQDGHVSFEFALLEMGTQCALVFLRTLRLKTQIQKVSDTQF